MGIGQLTFDERDFAMAEGRQPNAAGQPRRESAETVERMSLGNFARRVVVGVLVAILLVGLVALIWKEMRVLLLAFGGVLFGIFLSTLGDWAARLLKVRYGFGLAVTLLLLAVAATLLGWFLETRIANQIAELSKELPVSLGRIRDYLNTQPWGRYLLEQMPTADHPLANTSQFSTLTGLAVEVGAFFAGVFIILFVGVFGAAEPQEYLSGIFHLVPHRYRARLHEAMAALLYNLRWWLVGQVALMVMIGASTTLGLWLIGVPLALALGIIAGLLEIIPYIGPWISAIPALLMALLLSPYHVLATGALYLGLHILEGYILSPLIQRGVVLLPPAFTLVMQVILGDLFGFLGLFVAAPLTVSLVVIFKMLYVKDTLGDKAVDVPGEPDGNLPKVA
jgi:predicted PurR-regulated permease PerM